MNGRFPTSTSDGGQLLILHHSLSDVKPIWYGFLKEGRAQEVFAVCCPLEGQSAQVSSLKSPSSYCESQFAASVKRLCISCAGHYPFSSFIPIPLINEIPELKAVHSNTVCDRPSEN